MLESGYIYTEFLGAAGNPQTPRYDRLWPRNVFGGSFTAWHVQLARPANRAVVWLLA